MEYLTPGYEDMELSTQLVIKEALARGAKVEVLDRGDNFILVERGGRREYVKQATRTSADSYVSALVMENKEVAKIALGRAGVRVPAGSLRYDAASALKAAASFEGRPLVVKPRSTNFGDGVAILGPERTGADEEAAIRAALALDSGVVLEEYAAGREFRFLVIGGKTRAVLHRMPANVVGDGASCVRELVDAKNAHPYRGEGYHSPLERIRLGGAELESLAAAGLGPDSVVEAGRRVFLRRNSNISTGGDSIDFTDEMPGIYKRAAERAAAAAGARVSGVDMIVPELGDCSEGAAYTVIELNYNPALHIHDFPAEGANRRVERHLLDLIGFGEVGDE
jgi:D-alanine-D-alanine ligase-like ATP-grasp enzyme